MAQIRKDEVRETPENTQTLIKRVKDAGAALARRGNKIGLYFTSLDASAIATQRGTKDQLPRRLKAASVMPQIVTVQPRNGEMGGTYLIMPVEKVAETLEARSREEQFVPITVALREIGGDMSIPIFAPRGSGRRLRSSSPSITGK
jgi:hypothetical protein